MRSESRVTNFCHHHDDVTNDLTRLAAGAWTNAGDILGHAAVAELRPLRPALCSVLPSRYKRQTKAPHTSQQLLMSAACDPINSKQTALILAL